MPNPIVGLGVAVFACSGANAACSSTGATTQVTERLSYSGLCINTDESYYKDSSGRVLVVVDCKSCADGYYQSETSAYSSLCGQSYSYRTCLACPECDNCTESAGSWSYCGTGYEQKVAKNCDCGVCK